MRIGREGGIAPLLYPRRMVKNQLFPLIDEWTCAKKVDAARLTMGAASLYLTLLMMIVGNLEAFFKVFLMKQNNGIGS